MKAIAGLLDRSESMSPDHLKSCLESMFSSEGALPDIPSQFWSDPIAFVGLTGVSGDGAVCAPKVLHSPSSRYVGLVYGLLVGHGVQTSLDSEPGLFEETSVARLEEWLMQSLDERGIAETLKQLTGAFALALWDRHDRALSLACDQMGEETLYYSVLDGRFVFSTSLAALTQCPGFSGEIDRDALTLFLRYGFYPAPFSVFKNVKKLMAGTYVTFGIKHWDDPPCVYWSLGDELTSAQYRSAPPVGQNLKGKVHALKSAMCSRLGEGSSKLAFIDAEGLFSGAQDIFLKKEGGLQNWISVDSLLKDLPMAEEASGAESNLEYLNHILAMSSRSEPLADPAAILCGLLDATLDPTLGGLMIGDGLATLCGIESEDLLRKWSMFAKVPLTLRKLVGRALTIVPPGIWSGFTWHLRLILPRKIAFSRFGERLTLLRAQLFAVSFEDFLLCRRSIWFEPEKVVRQSTEPLIGLRNAAHWLRVRHLGKRRSFYDFQAICAGRFLAWANLARHRSIQIAKPFLVPEMALSLIVKQNDAIADEPHLMEIQLGLNRADCMSQNEIINRVGDWLRGPLKQWGHGLLNERQLKSDRLFNRGLIRRKWRQHQEGNNESVRELWAILVFMAWLEENRSSISKI